MSRLTALLRFVLNWLNTPSSPGPLEREMSPHDWADLPPHHPLCDSAPR